ncbi:ribonuclease H-like domain-containing protein [Tanacetum coccineum]
MDIEEMDINWQIAMIAIRMKKFYKKTGRRVRIDGNKPVGFDKKKLECFKCHNTGHFARECTSKGTNDGKKRDSFYQDQGARKKEQNQNCLLTMDDGVVNWGEHTQEEVETNQALMAISSNNEKIVDAWKDSSKNLWRLVDSGMSSTSKVGLGYEIKSNDEVLSYKEEMNSTVFNCTAEDFIDKPLYIRFSKTDSFKGVPHPLSGDYTPKPQQEIDESLYVYGKKGPQKPEISDSDNTSNEHSTCQSNDSEGSFGNPSEHSSESESESISVTESKEVEPNEKVVTESKEVEPSYRPQIKNMEDIRSDNGTEFKNRDMLEFCGNKGIKQEYSNARTPQQNGVKLQTPNANASEEEDEAEELIVVPTAVRHTASKVGPRKSSTNSKAEEFLTKLQNLKTQEKEAYSTGISEDTPEILAFRRELDELAQSI